MGPRKSVTKVTHVTSAHPWTDNRVHYRECVSLAEAGYDVTLVAATSPVKDAPRSAVRVITIPQMPRIRRALLGSLRVTIEALRTGATVLHLHDPELAWTIPILRLLRKTVIYDAHEDLPDQVLSKAYIHPLVRPFAALFAHGIVRVASLSNYVIAATPTIAKRFSRCPVQIVRNFPILRDSELDAPPILSRTTAAAYIGVVSTGRGAEVMVEACGHSTFPPTWKLRIAGPMDDPVHTRVSKLVGWQVTQYSGHLSPDDARSILLDAQIGLLVLGDTPAYRESLPNKLFEYLAAGLPVIASNFPLWRDIIENGDCGVLIDQTSPEALSEAIRAYADDADLLRRHSANARELAYSHFNWEQEVLRLLDVYRAVLTK